MKSSSKAQAIKAVLKECNAIRVRLGKTPIRKMKKGARFSGFSCPIARTIGCGVMNCSIGWHETHSSAMPSASIRPLLAVSKPVLLEFANAFDLGKYPELELLYRDY